MCKIADMDSLRNREGSSLMTIHQCHSHQYYPLLTQRAEFNTSKLPDGGVRQAAVFTLIVNTRVENPDDLFFETFSQSDSLHFAK